MAIEYETFKDGGLKYFLIRMLERINVMLQLKVNVNRTATEDILGLVKTNPGESVTLDSNGRLDVGGRLGAFPGTTGVFHSKDREPVNVADFSFMITDAKGMRLDSPRTMALPTGGNLTLKGSHVAGTTEYMVKNTYNNRIACSAVKYIALNEATAKVKKIEPVVSCTINGSSFTPDSSADSSTPIIIKVANTVNPDSSVTQIRVFSYIIGGFCSEYIGQCVGGEGGGSCFVDGQFCFNKSGNMNNIVGMNIFNTGNGNSLFGRHLISRKNRWYMSGTGHDNTSGKSESGVALGDYSQISSDTAFVVGNGTAHNARSNLFEVKTNGDVYINGVKKISGS